MEGERRKEEAPLFTFGACSDLQYADIDNRVSFHGNTRYYRNALLALRQAVETWNSEGVSFVMHLGDIIDGFARDRSKEALETILKEFGEYEGQVYHLLGNHELYHLPRDYLLSKLDMTSFHYEFTPHERYRFIVLDPYDVAVLGRDVGHPHKETALQMLSEKNPNKDKDDSSGLEGLDQRFVAYNGSMSKEQLVWLDETLADATKKQQKAVICSHVPLHPEAGSIKATLWNYHEALDIIHRYDCVVLVLSGHDHAGGYTQAEDIHHYVFEAIVECPPTTNAYSCIDVYEDYITLRGYGKIEHKTFHV